MFFGEKSMKEIKCLKKILLENQDKRILVLMASEILLQKIYQNCKIGYLYKDVLDELLTKEFGSIEKWYVSNTEKNKLEKQIKIVKNNPLFSHKIVDCDLILFLKIEPKVLKIICDYENMIDSYVLKKQQELLKEIREKKYPMIVVELYPKDRELEKMARNVYVLGNLYYYLEDKRGTKGFDDNHFHFPYIKMVDKIEELKRKQGFLLIISEDKLSEKNILEIDKKYRKLFNRFQFVYILTEDEKKLNFNHLKYSNIYYVNKEFVDNESILETYYEYLLNSKKVSYTKKKLMILEKMKIYFKGKKMVTTKELVDKFLLTPRSVERYMNDYNKIYKNIGYDYRENGWYIIN